MIHDPQDDSASRPSRPRRWPAKPPRRITAASAASSRARVASRPGSAARSTNSVRASCCLSRRSSPTGTPCSAAARRACWKSASAWARRPRKSRRTRPADDFLGVEVHEPGVGALLKLIGEQQLYEYPHHPARRGRSARTDDRAGKPRRRAHLFPGSVAQGASSQAPADPAEVRRAARIAPEAGRLYLHLATDWQNYAEQMLEVLSAEPALENTADGYAPRPDYRPVTKFERRGLSSGTASGIWCSNGADGYLSTVRLNAKTSRHARGPFCFSELSPCWRSLRPAQPAAISHDQDQQAKPDPIPRERREIVRRDVAQQPAHADERADERGDETDRETCRAHRRRACASLCASSYSRRAEDDRNGEEERKLGRHAPLEPEQHAADDRRARARRARNQREALREADFQRIGVAQIVDGLSRAAARAARALPRFRPQDHHAARRPAQQQPAPAKTARLDRLLEQQAEDDRRNRRDDHVER